MKNEGKHDVIMVDIVMNGNPAVETATFNSGMVYTDKRTVYSSKGKFFINLMGIKKEIYKERNCFVYHNWISILTSTPFVNLLEGQL